MLDRMRGRLRVVRTPKVVKAQRVRVVRGVSVVRGALSAKRLWELRRWSRRNRIKGY